jgi:hypothetical protein
MLRAIFLSVTLTAVGLAPLHGQTALTDLGAGQYLGQYQGGLYPGGVNSPPAAHQAAALQAAHSVVPRDRHGVPSPQGLIGFASISMSNANQEWTAFKRRADLDGHRNARVVLVNGAEGGQSLDVIANASAPYWDNLDQRIAAAGLTDEQVQVVWLKMADAQPTTLVFPDHAHNARANALEVLHILKNRYPNLAIAFFSSRSYGGYSGVANRSEPLSYETGFATKWLIRDQIGGLPSLNYDPVNGPVVAPLILWGPYLWTNGATPRADGLVWLPTDLEPDMVHPSASGEEKVAVMLETFFRNAPSAVPWYGKPVQERLVSIDASDDAWTDRDFPDTVHGSEDHLLVMKGRRSVFFKFPLGNIIGEVEHAELTFNTHPSVPSEPGLVVMRVNGSNWSESTLTFNNAPHVLGIIEGPLPELSRGAAVSIDVTNDVAVALGRTITFAISGSQGFTGNKIFTSREGQAPARLVITLKPSCDDPGVPYCPGEINSTGVAGELDITGSSRLSLNNMVLYANGLPIGAPAKFFFGFDSLRSPLGDGWLCVQPPIGSTSDLVLVNNLGQASIDVDFRHLSLVAGDTVYVQCAYLDPLGGIAGYNFTDGMLITLCP